MKKIIIPSLVDTYGLIKFWDFDCDIDLVSPQSILKHGQRRI